MLKRTPVFFGFDLGKRKWFALLLAVRWAGDKSSDGKMPQRPTRSIFQRLQNMEVNKDEYV
jgi:hypothetical protein